MASRASFGFLGAQLTGPAGFGPMGRSVMGSLGFQRSMSRADGVGPSTWVHGSSSGFGGAQIRHCCGLMDFWGVASP